MSLLTKEQRDIFDEAVRAHALDLLNGGEEGLTSPVGSPSKHHHHQKISNREKKGENKISARIDTEEHPCFALDENDPNYDSAEQNYELRQTRVAPRTDVIVAYKNAITAIIEEYFQTHDARETQRALDEKEAAAVLLSALYPHHIDPEQLHRGFERLLESVDDLAIDVPAAADDLAMFIARATVDDILPPRFLHTNLEGLLPGLRVGEKAAETIDLAHGHLHAHHGTERILRAWGDSDLTPLQAAKHAIQECLTEYVISGDVGEARRCLRSLHMNYFHHEFVTRALVLCIEAPEGHETAPRLLGLLKVLGKSGEVSASQIKIGFDRMDVVVEDLVLDVPKAKTRLEGLRLMAKEEAIHPMRD
jgi:programmed cell death protein 4